MVVVSHNAIGQRLNFNLTVLVVHSRNFVDSQVVSLSAHTLRLPVHLVLLHLARLRASRLVFVDCTLQPLEFFVVNLLENQDRTHFRCFFLYSSSASGVGAACLRFARRVFTTICSSSQLIGLILLPSESLVDSDQNCLCIVAVFFIEQY